MNVSPRTARLQRGAALMLLITVLVMGIVWYIAGALGKAAPSIADKEIRTGLALQKAKRALLDYVAEQAALATSTIPGRMPCPEPLAPAAGDEGIAAGLTCNDNTATYVGRLPWRTLGVEQIRDGHGEPLWYILGLGFRQSPINFGSIGEIDLDTVVDQAVALILAPGAALNTMGEPGAPPAACPRVNQLPRPLAAPFDPARFLECGRNATPAPGGDPEYVTTKTAPWTNDRLIAITAAELMDAIAGPVQDRVQREVAVVLGDWHAVELAATGRSWGAAPPNGWNMAFLPFASSWGDPTSQNYCGNQGEFEGLMPIDPTCYRNDWTNPTSNPGGGLTIIGGGSGCSDWNGTHLRCRYRRTLAVGALTARITARTNEVGRAFRSTITEADVIVSNGGSVTAMSMSIPNNTADATVTIDVEWPGLLALLQDVDVRIPYLQDAAVLSDPRLAWFWNNQWQRYAYYAVAPGATAGSATNCASPAFTGCLTVNGLPAGTGAADRKRLVLVMSGRTLPGKSQPSNDRDDYFETPNDDTDIASGNATFLSDVVTDTFNDRLAACPFEYLTAGGGPLTLCN